MKLINRTHLSTPRLEAMFAGPVQGWPHHRLEVHVRYARTRDFSGLCNYSKRRIHINVGRRLRFPYDLRTYLARARSGRRCWWREVYILRLADEYELALFLFLHEFYHWLVRRAGRNARQKEAMCDRFAARVLVDRFGVAVRDRRGRPVPRESWDFQDLDRFVAKARVEAAGATTRANAPRSTEPPPAPPVLPHRQLLLFRLRDAAGRDSMRPTDRPAALRHGGGSRVRTYP